MFSYLRLFAFACFAVLLVGCSREHHLIKIEGIKEISQHEVDRYSILIPNQKGGYETKLLVRCEAEFYEDVLPEKDMWVEEAYVTESSSTSGFDGHCIFHVHSLKELNGGGWNHGKFGSGQTTIITK